MAAPTITLYSGTVPDRKTQTQTVFSTSVATFLPYFNVIAPEYNDLANWVFDQSALTSQDVIDSAANALESHDSMIESASYAELSASSANLVGNWSAQSGAATKPYSAVHNGSMWALLNDLADVTSSEPGITDDWFDTDTTKKITSNRFTHFYRNR